MSTRSVRGPWRLLGTGSALPGQPITTEQLLTRIDERFSLSVLRVGMKIAGRLGMNSRHFARDWREAGEAPRAEDTNPALAARALNAALSQAGVRVDELAYLIGHTTTPHTLLPSNAAWVADAINYAGPYMELRQACTGFAQALQVAAGLLAVDAHAGTGDGACVTGPVAIVGSETGSVFLDPRSVGSDMGQLVNLVQMGDGAGAAILARVNTPRDAHVGLVSDAFVGSLGPGLAPGFRLNVGGSGQPSSSGVASFEHDFNSVRENGPRLFARGLQAAITAGIDIESIDLFLPHQANALELPSGLAKLLSVGPERIIIEADMVGNLGSASIWVALDRLRVSGRLAPGQRVLVLGAEATKYLLGGFVYTAPLGG